MLAAMWIAAIFWIKGLNGYIDRIQSLTADQSQKTDVIVVLTGGADRLQVGQSLLLAGMGKKLFITGVGENVKDSRDLGLKWPAGYDSACCVELGYRAEDTYGNAMETAHWMEQQGYHSMRLVTAAYHMPRSLMEFQQSMPDITIVPHPVFPAHVRIWDWKNARGSCWLVMGEYNKYLFAQLAHVLIETFLPS